jgi:hypothetical protein
MYLCLLIISPFLLVACALRFAAGVAMRPAAEQGCHGESESAMVLKEGKEASAVFSGI